MALTHRFSTYPLVDSLWAAHRAGHPQSRARRAAGQRATTRLREIACAPNEVPIARPEESLVELLERMHGCADGRAVVVDEAGRVVGVVSPSDVARSLQGG